MTIGPGLLACIHPRHSPTIVILRGCLLCMVFKLSSSLKGADGKGADGRRQGKLL